MEKWGCFYKGELKSFKTYEDAKDFIKKREIKKNLFSIFKIDSFGDEMEEKKKVIKSEGEKQPKKQ